MQPARRIVGTMRNDKGQASVGVFRDRRLDQLVGDTIDPMRILYHQEQGALPARRRNDLAEEIARVRGTLIVVVAGAARGRRRLVHQIAEQRMAGLAAEPHAGQQVGELSPALGRSVGVAYCGGGAQNLDERLQGYSRQLGTALYDPHDRLEVALSQQLVGESRLADAGWARERDDLQARGAPAHGGLEPLQLHAAPDKPNRPAPLEPGKFRLTPDRALETVKVLRSVQSFDRTTAEARGVDEAFDLLEHTVADPDLAFAGERLQSRRQVDRFAGDLEVELPLQAHVPQDHFAAADADAEPWSNAEIAGKEVRLCTNHLLQGQSGLAGFERSILERDRCAEDRQDAVAGVLQHVSAVALDADVGQRDDPADEMVDALGAQRFRRGRERGHVGEQHRCPSPFALDDVGRLFHRPPWVRSRVIGIQRRFDEGEYITVGVPADEEVHVRVGGENVPAVQRCVRGVGAAHPGQGPLRRTRASESGCATPKAA